MPKITLVKSNQPDSSKYNLSIVQLNDVKIGYVGHPDRIDHTHYIFIGTDARFKQFETMRFNEKDGLCDMIHDFCLERNIE